MLSGSAISEIMSPVLKKGALFRFQAKGFSMSPFIRDRDIITVSNVGSRAIQIGAVAVVVNPVNNALIVHRIVKKAENTIMLKGDNCIDPDGMFSHSSIIGIVTKIERDKKKVKFGVGFGGTVIAFGSRTGLLNNLLLPLLRKAKKLFLIDQIRFK